MSDVAAASSPHELFQVIGREFVETAPAGWATGTITFTRVGNTSQLQAIAVDDTGRVLGGRPTRTMSRAFNRLREMLAQPDKGAFLTAQFTVRASDGNISVDFDYDGEPRFDAPIHPGHYVEELDQHPRAPELVPDWWRMRLAEAERGTGT